MMAPWVYKPVEMSVTATPTLDGGRSGSPVLGAIHSFREQAFHRYWQCSSHMHKPGFPLDHDIIARRCSIWACLSVALGPPT